MEDSDDEGSIEACEIETNSLLRKKGHLRFRDVIEHLEVEAKRPFSNIEVAFLEREYVKTEFKMWLKESLRNVINDLENVKDIRTEISMILEQLDFLRSFHDIPKLPSESRVLNWCDGQRLQLILSQKDPFETLHAVNLASYYFKQFKENCNKVLSHRPDIGRDDVVKHKSFLIAFNDLVSFANDGDYKLQPILTEDLYDKLNDNTVQELVKNLVEKCALPGPVERFKRSAISLMPNDWTVEFQSLIGNL